MSSDPARSYPEQKVIFNTRKIQTTGIMGTSNKALVICTCWAQLKRDWLQNGNNMMLFRRQAT